MDHRRYQPVTADRESERLPRDEGRAAVNRRDELIDWRRLTGLPGSLELRLAHRRLQCVPHIVKGWQETRILPLRIAGGGDRPQKCRRLRHTTLTARDRG